MQIEFHMAVKQKNWKDISIRTKSAKKQLALIYKNAQSTLEKEEVRLDLYSDRWIPGPAC